MTGESLNHSISLSRPDVPYNVLQAVSVAYPDIALSDDGVLVGRANAPQVQIDDDLSFWLTHQGIPAENVCSRLSNYLPVNSSQEALLRAALYLANEGSTQRAMGLIAHGDPGLGKTHVSVGLAKEIASRSQGGAVTYMNPATQRNIPRNVEPFREMADNGRGTIIIDDVNSAYGPGADALRSAISAVHDVGGRLFVTSNASNLDDFLAKALRDSSPTADIEYKRLQDRVRGLLLPIHLEGESHRVNTSQNPWLGFMAIEQAQKPDDEQ